MTDKQQTYCDVCGRRDSWGCGHTGSQRWAARRHKATRKHRERRCECYPAAVASDVFDTIQLPPTTGDEQ